MTLREQRLSYLAHQMGSQFADVAAAISEIAAMEDDFAHRITTAAQGAYLNAKDERRAEAALFAVKGCADEHAAAMAALLDRLSDAVACCANNVRNWD